jgi:hypothetical protein
MTTSYVLMELTSPIGVVQLQATASGKSVHQICRTCAQRKIVARIRITVVNHIVHLTATAATVHAQRSPRHVGILLQRRMTSSYVLMELTSPIGVVQRQATASAQNVHQICRTCAQRKVVATIRITAVNQIVQLTATAATVHAQRHLQPRRRLKSRRILRFPIVKQLTSTGQFLKQHRQQHQ